MFACVNTGSRRETVRIEADPFAKLLRHWLYQAEHAPCAEQAVKEAAATIAARASHEGVERAVFRRIGRAEDALYLDLADAEGRAVEVTAQGWRILSQAPVSFVRSSGMLALPPPVPGGALSDLFALINLPPEHHPLSLAWLVGALQPDRPFPLLAVHGEQGSGKSTACKMLRALIDPHAAPLRSVPRDTRSLMIATRQIWILGFDNLSDLPVWLSDAQCCIATGTAFPDRVYYTNDREMLFVAKQPILINGVEEVATRADLLDRCIVLHLQVIPKEKRRPESELWSAFYELRPRLPGALLDAASCALRREPEIKSQKLSLPRMADFAIWATAAEPALGLREGEFLAAYAENIEAASDLPLEASAIAAPLRVLLDKQEQTLDGQPPRWRGTAKDLLAALREIASDAEKRQSNWPKNPQALRGQLNRLAPNFRQKGIHFDFGRAADRKRTRQIAAWSEPC